MSKAEHSHTAQARLFLVANRQPRPGASVSKVADILEREAASTTRDWVSRVRGERELCAVYLHEDNLCAHLAGLFRDLITRLRFPTPAFHSGRPSILAAEYGYARYQQGYSPAMMVEESRLLRASILNTLQNNTDKLDMARVLEDIAAIGDELDAQLAEAISSYIWHSKCSILPSVEKTGL